MPEGAVYVGRPSRWGNEMEDVLDDEDITPGGIRAEAETWLAPLRGHDLACWCPLDQPCHADVLLELANR